ncbi:MAG TPA: biotin/lipoyl-containing protein [Pyrinomonadaceae bacterium]|jgi:biotin carboxyl carrier protein
MKLMAELDGAEHALELTRDGARVAAAVDGRRYELTARVLEPGVYLLQLGGHVYECRVDDAAASDAARTVTVGQQHFQVALRDPKRLSHAHSAGGAGAGRASLTAAMPGKVVRVLVEAGAHVEAGDALLVVEAMKMQNELKAPKTGTVIEVHAQPGTTVNAGDVLVVVE